MVEGHTPPVDRRERLLALVGYMPESRARRAGFTHHARLYTVIPSWYAPDGFEGCVLVAKWAPLEWLDPIVGHLWWLAWICTHDEEEPPMFGIHLGRRIE